tara:strand:+ start:230 stop:457 length:228 start_codon:yes stop_codon:yes gene_type:complete
MNNEDKFNILKKILERNFKFVNVNKNTDITKKKGWDSLKHIELIMLIEKKFEKKLKTKDFFKLKSVKNFLEIIDD